MNQYRLFYQLNFGQCEICKKSSRKFQSKYKYYDLIKCSFCDMCLCFDSLHYHQHIYDHFLSNIKIFSHDYSHKCPICLKTFISTEEYYIHINDDEEKIFYRMCDKKKLIFKELNQVYQKYWKNQLYFRYVSSYL